MKAPATFFMVFALNRGRVLATCGHAHRTRKGAVRCFHTAKTTDMGHERLEQVGGRSVLTTIREVRP